LEAFAMEDLGLFYGHLVYFVAILVYVWYMLWVFVIFSPVLVRRKIWQPCRQGHAANLQKNKFFFFSAKHQQINSSSAIPSDAVTSTVTFVLFDFR
jgi:hypothetical protein